MNLRELVLLFGTIGIMIFLLVQAQSRLEKCKNIGQKNFQCVLQL